MDANMHWHCNKWESGTYCPKSLYIHLTPWAVVRFLQILVRCDDLAFLVRTRSDLDLNFGVDNIHSNNMSWYIFNLVAAHCFWPALYSKFSKPLKKCFIFQILRSQGSDTPRSSGWLRWKADNFLLNFKKESGRKIFFHHREILFWKFQNFENSKNLKNIFEKYQKFQYD